MTQSTERGVSVAPPPVFSRKATGLVREARVRDILAYNVNVQGPVIGLIFMLLLIPGVYPGANIYLATLIALAVALPISYVYAQLAGVFPRSGGDYVFVSRIIHPAIGFMSNFSYQVWGAFYVGVGGVFLADYGVGPTLRVLGAYMSNESLVDAGNWFTTNAGKFLLGTAVFAVFISVLLFGGLRTYFRVQNISFILATLGLISIILIGLLASQTAALDNLDDATNNLGGSQLSPLASGDSGGAFSLKDTLFASIWAWLFFNGAIFSTYMGGEVKHAARSQVLGIIGSLIWSAILVLLVCWAMLSLFGNTFLTNLLSADPTEFGLSSTPTFGELTALATGQLLVGAIVMICFSLSLYVWVGTYPIMLTRTMLAWSLDRLGPAKLAEVSERWHSPVYGLITIFVIGSITAAFYVFGELVILVGTVGLGLSMMVVALAGILLPYRQRSLWESSPAYGYTFGIPTITLVGIVSMPLLLLIQWALLADVNSGTSIEANGTNVAIVAGIFVVGLPLYYAMRAVQRARGIDIDLAFKEIPPE